MIVEVGYVVGGIATVAYDRWASGSLRGDWSTSLAFGALWPVTWILLLAGGASDRAVRRDASCGELEAFVALGQPASGYAAIRDHLRSCWPCRRVLRSYERRGEEVDREVVLSEGTGASAEYRRGLARSPRRSRS